MTVRATSTVALVGLFLLLPADGTFHRQENKVHKIGASEFRAFVFSAQARFLRLTSEATYKHLKDFNEHYAWAAAYLEPYNIQLAELSCDEHPTFDLCTKKHPELHLYGFKGSMKEKLVLPVDTLADENAIVASALHLDLINKVPIIQSVLELNNLNKKCSGKCDIILSYHNTLGTKEHRLFLSLAWKLHSNSKLFALTTSALASPLKHKTNEARQQHVHMWQLQCKRHKCQSSAFHNIFREEELNSFVAALDLPSWVEGKDWGIEEIQKYPYLLMIYDDKSKMRVLYLADGLAITFRGTIFVVVYSVQEFAKISSMELESPSMIFVPLRNGSCINVEEGVLQNGLEDVKSFVKEQILLEVERQMCRLDVVDSRFSTSTCVRKTDDEGKCSHADISRPEIKSTNAPAEQCRTEGVHLIDIKLFYVTWDEASQAMLKTFDRLEGQQGSLPIKNISRVDCLSDRDECDKIETYPTLEFRTAEKSFRTRDLPWERLINFIYSIDRKVKEFAILDDFLKELESAKNKFIPTLGLILDKDGIILKRNLTNLDLGINCVLLREEAAVYMEDKLGCSSPCFGINKLDDPFEPFVTFPKGIDLNGPEIKQFVQDRQHPILPEMKAENFPWLRNKLLVIALGLELTEPIIESALRASAEAPEWLAFSYIKRDANWFERVRRVHLQKNEDAGLVALHLAKGCSYFFSGDLQRASEIWHWIQDVYSGVIEPSVYLPARPCKSESVDFLGIKESDPISAVPSDSESLFVVLESGTEQADVFAWQKVN